MWEFQTRLSTTLVLIIVLGAQVMGQVSGNSPYSRFGLGDLNDGNFVHLQSMGGLTAAYSDLYQTNLSNPASLSRLQATSFEVGFDASRSFLSADGDKAQFWGGGMNYLSLSFPIFNPLNRVLDRKSTDIGWGTNIALRPFSRTNAVSSFTETLDEVGSVTREFEGSGALNQVSFSNGVHYKNFAAGLHLGYVFGQIKQERSILYNSIRLPYHIYTRDDFSFRGFVWNMGFQYELDLSNGAAVDDVRKTNKVTFGVTLGTNGSLTAITDRFRATRQSAWTGLSDDIIEAGQEETDTISFITDGQENTSIPATFQVGAIWSKGQRFMVGINFSRSKWSVFESTSIEGDMANSYRLGIGGELVLDQRSYRPPEYRKRLRLGLTFGTDPRLIDNEQIKETIFNAGIGLPIYLSRQISFVNLGIEYANRGGGLPIKENRLTFKMGVTLNNNLWFYKRKYN